MIDITKISLSILPIAAFSSVVGKSYAQSSVNRPNIIYIMSDDHARQAISAYGSVVSSLARMPYDRSLQPSEWAAAVG